MSAAPRIDCHLHLTEPVIDSRLDDVLAEARQAGVDWMVCNGTSPDDWAAVGKVARTHSRIVPCFGLHPWFVAKAGNGWLERLEQHLREIPSAVGEIGLDRWLKDRDEVAQERAFLAQLDLARRLDRPVMIHCLKAHEWMLTLLRRQSALPAMMIHGFGSPADCVKPLAEMGAYFSFSGTALNERHRKARAALAVVPPDRLLVETDAPDMLPPPGYRPFTLPGDSDRARNHPANLPTILRGLAELRGMSEDELADNIWDNARRLLGPLLDEPTEVKP